MGLALCPWEPSSKDIFGLLRKGCHTKPPPAGAAPVLMRYVARVKARARHNNRQRPVLLKHSPLGYFNPNFLCPAVLAWLFKSVLCLRGYCPPEKTLTVELDS